MLNKVDKEFAMRNKGIFFLLLSVLTFSPLSTLSSELYLTKANKEETVSALPKGWDVEILDDAGTNPIETPYLSASAFNDPSKGNSLKLSRQISAYQLHANSEFFIAQPSQEYKIDFLYRNDCLDDDENVFAVSVIEKKIDGTTIKGEISSINGRYSSWSSFYGYYSSSNDCQSLSIQVSASGFGDFFVSNIEIKGAPSPFYTLKNFGLCKGEPYDSSNTFTALKASDLVDDASSGEKALKITDKAVALRLGFLPIGQYELKFKYKHQASLGTYMNIRLDNISMDGQQKWYAIQNFQNDTNGQYLEFSYKFQRSAALANSCHITYMGIQCVGTWLLDDLGIYDEERNNYVPDGSFEGYDFSGISLEGNVGICKNSNGGLNFAASYKSYANVGNSIITISPDAINLKAGKKYIFSFETRNGSGKFGKATYGSQTLIDSLTAQNNSSNWIKSKSDVFYLEEGASLIVSLCLTEPTNYDYLGYLRNISIIDYYTKEECLNFEIKEHITDPSQLGDNIFPFGKFEYTFPEPGGDSSSSSEDIFEPDISSSEDSSSSSSSSSFPSTNSSSSSSINGSDDLNKNKEEAEKTAKATLGVGITVVVLASGGFIVALLLLLKGIKK